MAYSDYESVIGLEIHAQLATDTKAFSAASGSYGAADNAHTSPICLGMPGTLPRLNLKAVEYSIKTGLALNCKINKRSVFARKQYFYPDLPKGYQISQFDEPLCVDGYVEFSVDEKPYRIRIERAHMEEDAGKSIHFGDHTLVNFNRAGVPLLEIVSGPDMRSATEAAEYARTVRTILRYLGVCDGNLEEGSLRCDCNVSVRKRGETKLGTKVELKNINSFRFIEKAIDYEIQRQIDCVESAKPIVQETRLYDSTKNMTFSMRSKEEAHDYRYFPDADLLPLEVSDSWVEKVRATLPELPLDKGRRFVKELGLPEYDAQILTQDKDLADYFEVVQSKSQNPKSSSNWIMGDFLKMLNEQKLQVTQSPVSAENLAILIQMIDKGEISGKIAKTVFTDMWNLKKDPKTLVSEQGLAQISDDSALEKFVDEVLLQNPENVKSYREGKAKLFGFFVGQVMKVSKGQANPESINRIIKQKLES
jgi:aspartyl-tRNA(Asn)/glutamyl-tRNA(Gln) amidotransferase subunit B